MQRAHSSAFRTSYEIQIIESNSQKYVNEVDMVLFSVLVTVPSRQSTNVALELIRKRCKKHVSLKNSGLHARKSYDK